MKFKGANYIAVIDWKAETREMFGMFSWIPLDADNVVTAMKAANVLFTDDVYLIDIIELVDTKSTDGLYGTDSRTWFWKPILQSRSWNRWSTFAIDAHDIWTEQTYWTSGKFYSNFDFSSVKHAEVTHPRPDERD